MHEVGELVHGLPEVRFEALREYKHATLGRAVDHRIEFRQGLLPIAPRSLPRNDLFRGGPFDLADLMRSDSGDRRHDNGEARASRPSRRLLGPGTPSPACGRRWREAPDEGLFSIPCARGHPSPQPSPASGREGQFRRRARLVPRSPVFNRPRPAPSADRGAPTTVLTLPPGRRRFRPRQTRQAAPGRRRAQ